jgi:error-prone DNA polymerase
VRLGFRQVDGLREDEMEALMAARGPGYTSPDDLRRRTGLGRAPLERLATADTFGSVGLSRREALWHVRGEVVHQSLPLFTSAGVCEQGDEAGTQLPLMPPSEHVIQDYQTARLSLKAHPMLFLREGYRARRILPTAQAVLAGNGRRVETAGLVLVRQRPGSANGVVFITIEDETGAANIVIQPDVWGRADHAARRAAVLIVHGRIQRRGPVVHVVATHLEAAARRDDDAEQPSVASPALSALPRMSRDFC